MIDDRENLTAKLLETLGEDGFFELVEAYGGLRLYVPRTARNTSIAAVIGTDLTIQFCKEFGGIYISVPIAREFRAKQYHNNGMTFRQIAVRLCITERAVERIFQRLRRFSNEAYRPNRK